MAERVVSPGVFTRERDLSFLQQGVANIGGAFVGVTQKGPAFVPVIVNSQTEFEERFGIADEFSYLAYTVQNYLQEAQSATVVRVLGLDGYTDASFTSARLVASGSGGERILAVIHPTTSSVRITSASIDASNVDSLGIDLFSSAVNATSSYTGVSISGSDASSVRNSLGIIPESSEVGYTYAFFPNAIDPDAGGLTDVGTVTIVTGSALDFSSVEYVNASTPWIRSQLIGGSRYDLFKVHTLTDGSNSNQEYKISIQSIKYRLQDGEYGTFSLLVRRASDTDSKAEVLEQYDNLTLDPNSSDFIGRRIGTSAPSQDAITNEFLYQGDFPNNSRYIRIELSADAYSLPETALPYGFAAISSPVLLSGVEAMVPAQVVNTAWTSASVVSGYKTGSTRDSRKFYGYDYTETNYTNWSYLSPLPTGASTVTYLPTSASATTVTEFSLDNVATGEVEGTDLSITTADHIAYRKFTVPFQGGFDGYEPNRHRAIGAAITATNSQGFNLQSSADEGSRAYKQAIDSIKNPESYDINLLIIPGVNYEQHPYITQYAIDVCEDRQDCFYIMDLASYGATISTVTSTAASVDTNYAAGYYPWVKVLNTNNNRFLWAPPSVVLAEVFAYNDNVSAEWFAPAGLNRGGIPGAVGVKSRLNRANRDTLYENRVNPIATFPGQGIVAFGQKTLQLKASALDRINVRRLLIALKKFIASSSRFLLFEQNTETTRNRFLNIVNPYLASVQERQGLFAFRVVMDDSNNTPDVIDRNQLVGQIYLQPARSAEFIILDFNILPTGATFPGS